MKQGWRRLHRWLVWSTGFLLIPWVTSGCLLLWQDAGIPRVRPAGNPASLERLLAVAQTIFPSRSGDWRLVLPRRPDDPVKVVYVASDPFGGPEAPVSIYVDPYRAEVLTLTEGRGPFWEWLYRFHTCLLLPGDSRWLLWVLSAALAGILVSGAQLSRRGKSRHARIGRTTIPPLLISLLSGLVLLAPLPAAESSLPLAPPSLPKHVPPVDEVVARIGRDHPALELREILWTADGSPWRLAYHRPGTSDLEPAWTTVWFDPGHGTILRISAPPQPYTTLRRWAYWIHRGALAEPWERLVLTWGGIGLTMTAFTGVFAWWQRRRRHGIPAVQNPV